MAAGVALVDIDEPTPDLGWRLEPVFGCKSWTPQSEGETRTVTVELASGEVVTGEVCFVCGSGAGGRDRLASDQFCAACERSRRDHKILSLLREAGHA